MDPALHGAGRAAEDLAHLTLTEIVVIAQHQRLALGLGKLAQQSLGRERRLEARAGLALSAENSQTMLCGNPAMVEDTQKVLVARGMRAAGRRVACIGLADQYVPELPALCDDFAEAGVVQLGKWLRLARRFGVREAVMVGRVSKARMHDPLRVFRQLPDWRAFNLWYRKLRHDRRSSTLLTALAEDLAKEGLVLIDSTTFIPDHMASEGTMTRRAPTAPCRKAIATHCCKCMINVRGDRKSTRLNSSHRT